MVPTGHCTNWLAPDFLAGCRSCSYAFRPESGYAGRFLDDRLRAAGEPSWCAMSRCSLDVVGVSGGLSHEPLASYLDSSYVGVRAGGICQNVWYTCACYSILVGLRSDAHTHYFVLHVPLALLGLLPLIYISLHACVILVHFGALLRAASP